MNQSRRPALCNFCQFSLSVSCCCNHSGGCTWFEHGCIKSCEGKHLPIQKMFKISINKIAAFELSKVCRNDDP